MHENVAERGIGEYLEALGGTDSMPGGGSAAGIVGALAAATAQMMASLTREQSPELIAAKDKLVELRARALECASDDEKSYGGYLDALSLPKSTDEEKSARKSQLAASLEASARVPLALAVVGVEIVDVLDAVIRDGNKTVLGDAESAIVMAMATVDVCEINVRANLKFIKDESLANSLQESISAAKELIVHLAAERRAQIEKRRSE